MTSPIRTYNPQPTYEVFRPFNLALGARTGDLLFVTGQVGFDDDGTFPEGYEAQLENVFRHLDRILTEGGSAWDHVVQMRSFHVGTDLDPQFPPLLAIKQRYMPAHQHAWTAIGVSALIPSPSLLEIDLIAATQADPA
jgi:enamine deaminase RidA (YjgF/YER057c/UK114 family)